MTPDLRQKIRDTLVAFDPQDLRASALSLLDTLGYRSDRTLDLDGTPQAFLRQFDPGTAISDRLARKHDWQSVHFLFQLTDDDIKAAGGQQMLMFDSTGTFDNAIMESYVFLAVELQSPQNRTGDRAGRPYTRTELAGITRAVNRPFPMPAMLLFRHGDTLTLSVIHRRLHKRKPDRDVLEKVTLIKDVRFADPLRAHVEILHDLSLHALHDEYSFHNFIGLHRAWEKRLDSYALNERFYREIADWYFWALGRDDVVLPRTIEEIADPEEREKQRAVFLIRLLTRLVFCWFLQEKRLIPRDLFRRRTAEELLEDFSPKAGTYYRAFLQNLFFATLNQEQNQRGWRKKYQGSRDGNRGITNLWRYGDYLTEPQRLEALLREQIPFVNGGLFDCLDDQEADPMVFLDGFSERLDNQVCLPNDLFFGDERVLDLSAVYDDKRRKREKVRGLIEILNRYKFTVEENTPLEEEVALDPELLGKVFENLLASYNEDTRTTARKALGAFYTPRKIVGYMVDESLKSYLTTQVATVSEEALDTLLEADPNGYDAASKFSTSDREALINAIGRVKIIDPACGSGAFPIGALHRLVDLLQKLDPNNENWKRDRLVEAERYHELLRSANASDAELAECANRIEDIRHSFDTRFHALDFGRKLYLIENCIYGIDILPIACQIAKLRFFIALIVDQNADPAAPNLGVRPLPNLETRIVAADTLVPIKKAGSHQFDLLDAQVRPLRKKLEQVRHDHFNARTPSRKQRCREEDKRLREQIADLLRDSGMPADTAARLAEWDPYDQNHAARFFDTKWMFGLPVGTVPLDHTVPATMRGNFQLVNEAAGQMEVAEGNTIESGFDIVLGNPPYVRIQTLRKQDPKLVAFYKEHYVSAKKGNYDLYVVFVEAGLKLLKADGHLAYILPHKFFNAKYGEPLRKLIADGHHLQHVVHLGDQQVFPGATNYVCLLFLAKAGAEECQFVKVDDVEAWLESGSGTEGDIASSDVGATEWNFSVGREGAIYRRLRNMPLKLEDVTTRIFQGIKTSADKVYVVEERYRTDSTVVVFSPQTEKEHELEQALLHPLAKGGDSKAYALMRTNRLILFPYQPNVQGTPRLIAAGTLSQRYPMTWAYLKENREFLEGRESGAFCNETWYAYGRSQAIEVIHLPKIFAPDLAPTAAFSLDVSGEVFFTGGVAGGYGILPAEGWDLRFLMALLNSRPVDFYHHLGATQMRGGWFSYKSRFIKNLPIASATASQKAQVLSLVGYVLWLNEHFQNHDDQKTARDSLMLGYFEQLINGLVYELYFPDELHEQGLGLFDLAANAGLPDINNIAEADRLQRLREVFETIYHTSHPLRGALYRLHSLETIRIIEGKE